MIRSVQPVLLEIDREVEDAAGVAGRHPVHRLSPSHPAQPAARDRPGAALAFARAIGEFGSVVLMSGNIPFSTEVASVHIFAQVQSDNRDGAAALSVLMLGLALGMLLAMGALERWGSRHDR